MKELSIEEKAKAYDEAKARMSRAFNSNRCTIGFMNEIFHELKESEDDKIREQIIYAINKLNVPESEKNKLLAWLENIPYTIDHEKREGFHLGYKAALEKQGEKQQKTPIWKHWKDGIAGNGEGKPIYLIKYCHTYSLSSCLCFECDYIKLSELDKLMLEKQETSYTKRDVDDAYLKGISDAKNELEKQGEQKPIIEMITPEESLGIDSETYNEIVNACIFGENKPKFKVGDTIKKESTGDIVTISEIDLKNREYRLSNTGFIPFKYEHLWELVEQKPAWSEEDEEILNGIIDDVKDRSRFCEIEQLSDIYHKEIDWLKSLKQRIKGDSLNNCLLN